MVKDTKYGEITTELKDIPEDEPRFLLRAQDDLSIATLMAYRTFANFTRTDDDFLASIDQVIETFERWQDKNYTKRPD